MTKSEKNKNYILKKQEQGFYRLNIFLTKEEIKIFKDYIKLEANKRTNAMATIEKIVARTVQPQAIHHTTRENN